MNKFLLLGFTAIILVFTQVKCTKDVTPPAFLSADCPDTISFLTQVKPIFDINCSTSGCHDAASASSGYVFESHAEIAANATNVLKSMRNDGLQLMPQGGPALADSLIQQFSCWINQGKQNN